MTGLHVKRSDFRVLGAVIRQLIAALACLLVGAPIGWFLPALAEDLAANHLGMDPHITSTETVGQWLARFSLAGLIVAVGAVTEQESRAILSQKKSGWQALGIAAACEGIAIAIPVFLAGHNRNWDAFVLAVITGALLVLVLSILVAAIQASQHWLDPAGYSRTQWLMSHQGALVACRNSILPFRYHFRNTWHLLGAVLIAAANVVALFWLVPAAKDSGIEECPIENQNEKLDETQEQTAASSGIQDYLMPAGGTLAGILGAAEAYFKLYRSKFGPIEGEIEKIIRDHRNSRAGYHILVQGEDFRISRQTWDEFEDGKLYRLFFVVSRFIFEDVKLEAFEPIQSLNQEAVSPH